MIAEEQQMSQQMHAIAHQPYPAGEPSAAARPATAITPEMTVNYVLWTCPQARPVFEAFHVDWQADGLRCLDELYWLRGVDVPTLVSALEHYVAHSQHTERMVA